MTNITSNTSHKTGKQVSIALVCIATLLLTLNIIDIQLVFGKTETGLWDTAPSFVRQAMLLGYPICILTSYATFVWTRKVKSQFDTIATILFLLNLVALVMFTVIFLTK
jgi:cytochrome bd-type quinol oxidase subunit 2